MTKAIAQVIELTCKITHNGKLNVHQDNVGTYGRFWRALIKWADARSLPVPPILTFNYDLVLERSLLHALVGKYYRNSVEFKHGGVEINYAGAAIGGLHLKTGMAKWQGRDFREEPGMILEEFESGTPLGRIDFLKFEILKLHGSVNFPHPRRPLISKQMTVQELITPSEDPLILPPIFNKATDVIGRDVWGRALEVLRNCKRLIICGYSLPSTDIYMQYFLKAALGPNRDLDRIYVFDPVICDKQREADGEALRQRYACNFSQPIQRRIDFVETVGTTKHLVHLLENHPEALLFG